MVKCTGVSKPYSMANIYFRFYDFLPKCFRARLVPLFDFLGPNLNFFSLTVCTLEQYLKNGSENTVLLP